VFNRRLNCRFDTEFVCAPVTNHCCPQNRTQNINPRRLNNFLGAMCLEEQEFIILKYFILPTNKALCFLCSSFFLLISIVQVLHHCNTLQSAGVERMTDCPLLKGKVHARLQQYPCWERYPLHSPPLHSSFFFFSLLFFPLNSWKQSYPR